jgi:hypothetical protein
MPNKEAMSDQSNSSFTDGAEADEETKITKERINTLTLPFLKSILLGLQQPTNGKKSELVSRIVETYNEANANHNEINNLINSALAAMSKGNQYRLSL